MSEIRNIKGNEFPVLAEVVLEENDGDITKSAKDIRKIDLMLGVMETKDPTPIREKNKKRPTEKDTRT